MSGRTKLDFTEKFFGGVTLLIAVGCIACIVFLAEFVPKLDEEHSYKQYEITRWTELGKGTEIECKKESTEDRDVRVQGAVFECNGGRQRVAFATESTLKSVCDGPQSFEVEPGTRDCADWFDNDGKKKDDAIKVRAPYHPKFGTDYTDSHAEMTVGLAGGLLGFGVLCICVILCWLCCFRNKSDSNSYDGNQ